MDPRKEASCLWLERVSALIDGELPDAQKQMVESHAQSCITCQALLKQQTLLDATFQSQVATPKNSLTAFSPRHTPQLRVLLAVIGALIVLGSMPGFIRGNTSGNSLHDLRHLSIWQVAVGVGALSASVSFRISRLLTVMIATFLVLTSIATVYDLLTGHRGPWTDPLHLVEIVAVLAIMRLVSPHLYLRRIRKRQLFRSH